MGVWLIIAGVLLLGHSSALAEPYLRVRKNGVTYYYFNSRQSPQPRQRVINTPTLPVVPPAPLIRPNPAEGEALIQEPSPHPNLLKMADDLRVVNPYDLKQYICAGARYLIGFMTPSACRYPLAVLTYNPWLRRAERYQNSPSIQEPRVVVPEVGGNFPNHAQEQTGQWDQVKQGADSLEKSSPLLYSFPVSRPFSFRDTWGDYRNGGRYHRAVDIFAPEGTAVYAITLGFVHTLATFKEAGITLLMQGQDGRGYGYMHLQGYAEGIVVGKAVRTGELLGYVGRTGLQTSAAHLHFQVYGDQRLCKDELINPYNFLVQLCRGVGVTDLYHHQIAYLQDPKEKVNKIQVYRRPRATTRTDRSGRRIVKDPSILVIRNF